MHHRHHNRHNHRINHLTKLTMTKLFKTLYTVLYMYTQTASLKELWILVKLSTHVSGFSHLNMFFGIMT